MAEHRVEHVMGTVIGIEVRDHAPGDALEEAFASFRHVERIFSPFDEDSEICRIDAGLLAREAADPTVQEVLAHCEDLRTFTGGFFDPLASGRLDPSGLVKGWAAERAAAVLERAGVRSFSINAGGDAVLRGDAIWRVGIQHPLERHLLAAVLELTDAAVATSGCYERGSHIVDPHSRRAPTGLLSVTVVGPDLGTADAYATAAFAMGLAAPEWTASLQGGYEAMTILRDRSVLCTRGFLAHCRGGSPAASLAA